MSKPSEIDVSKFPVRKIALALIVEPAERLRELQPKKVEEIAKSLKETGLIHPIVVRQIKSASLNGHQRGGTYELVVGLHRLRAANQLKWKEITCWVKDLDDDGAKLTEIDENLRRADPSPEERSASLLKWKEIWERREAQDSRQHGAKPKSGPMGGRPKGFTSDAAEKTGRSKRSIQRELAKSKPKPSSSTSSTASPDPKTAKPSTKKEMEQSDAMLGTIKSMAMWPISSAVTVAVGVGDEPDAIAILRGEVRAIHKWLDAFMGEVNRALEKRASTLRRDGDPTPQNSAIEPHPLDIPPELRRVAT